MQIGDTVLTKSIGLPSTGKIVGMCTSEMFINYLSVLLHFPIPSVWPERYPQWTEKEVAFVEFPKRQRITSFASYCRALSDEVPVEDAKVLYKYGVPEVNLAMYPCDDLEVLE